MGVKDGITTSSLLRRGCGRGKPDGSSRAKAAHVTTIVESADSRSRRRVGAKLLTRRAHGIELTPAGRAFLDHARVVLSQAEAAGEAARRAVHPA
jgi:DNA-binding transcriptional LysR family regulator